MARRWARRALTVIVAVLAASYTAFTVAALHRHAWIDAWIDAAAVTIWCGPLSRLVSGKCAFWHSFNRWTVILPAWRQTRMCRRCGWTQSRPVPEHHRLLRVLAAAHAEREKAPSR